MTLLQCGCEQDGSVRCRTHAYFPCHDDGLRPAEKYAYDDIYPACPPCRIAKWRSVSLSSAATPTRKR